MPSPILKATGPTIVRIGFDPEAFNKLLPDQQKQHAYHILRLFRGETTAESEWTHLGLRIRIDPWQEPSK